MRFRIGLVSKAIPAHAFGVHVGKIFVFAVAAYTAFTDAVIQVATLVFQLVNSKTLTDVGAVDDYTFSHVYLANSSLMIRTS
jgi:hypothetical protein